MRCGRELMLALALMGPPSAHAADALAVDVINASEPTLCAEKDNVYLKLQSAEVRRFTVEAAHPTYVGSIVKDQWAPDFTNCDMSSDPSFKFEKRRLTIYETEEWQLVGLTFPSFWRPNQVPVTATIARTTAARSPSAARWRPVCSKYSPLTAVPRMRNPRYATFAPAPCAVTVTAMWRIMVARYATWSPPIRYRPRGSGGS